MKFLVILSVIAIIGFATVAVAQTTEVCFDMPDTAVVRNEEICELVQEDFGARDSTWTFEVCISELVRGVFHKLNARLGSESDRAVRATAQRTDYPDTVVRGACGDGEKETWEECDDGNTTNGDGCSERCELEPVR